jgi:hypothetical protein
MFFMRRGRLLHRFDRDNDGADDDEAEHNRDADKDDRDFVRLLRERGRLELRGLRGFL